jgi:hypothetical protein
LFSSGIPAEKKSENSHGGFAMSAIRKIVLSAAALFLGLSALFMATGTATAVPQPTSVQECDNDWQTSCP